MNTIFLIIAPSGAGKTTISERLEQDYHLSSISSYTTRKPRYPGEKGHIFVSEQDFDNLKDIVAYTKFCNSKYCATSDQVDNNDLYVIDPKGVDYFRNSYHGKKHVKTIYIKASKETRRNRLIARSIKNGKTYGDAVDEANTRIINDRVDFDDYESGYIKADFTISNDAETDLDVIASKIFAFIQSVEQSC